MSDNLNFEIRINQLSTGRFSISKWIDGKRIEAYRPTDKFVLISDLVNVINGSEPEHFLRNQEKQSD